MKTLAPMTLAALLLAGCAAHDGPPMPPNDAAGDTGPEADQAIAIARQCITGEPWGNQNEGYSLDGEHASAHRDAGARFRVRVPERFYLGRLPPPRPAGALWVMVDLATKGCAPGTSP
ncbi:MAG: hypothetical protein U0359_04740 [Byssovorax sp.]